MPHLKPTCWGASLYYYCETRKENVALYLAVWANNRYRAQDEVLRTVASMPKHCDAQGRPPRITLVSIHPIEPGDRADLEQRYLAYFADFSRTYRSARPVALH